MQVQCIHFYLYTPCMWTVCRRRSFVRIRCRRNYRMVFEKW